MKKWEYYITDDENSLEYLGKEGWELVSVICDTGEFYKEYRIKFYLKRELILLTIGDIS